MLLLWNYRQWQQISMPAYTSPLDERTRLLQDRVEVLNRRVGDMEILVLILLGTSGLYSIVFVTSSYLSSMSFARQADRTVADFRDQIGIAMGNLRELKEEAQHAIRVQPQLEPPASERSVFESQMSEELAELYRSFAAICMARDTARAVSCLHRALVLAPSSEVRYELACAYAASRDFELAVNELSVAFQAQSRELDERLARDIEEGGCLYELASTVPFDKAVNDVLLNVVL